MELESIGWLIQNATLAAHGAAEARRANAQTARANDLAIAGRIHSNAARANAAAAVDSEVNLICAQAEISRLRELVDELTFERSNLIEVAADLLSENDRLRAHY